MNDRSAALDVIIDGLIKRINSRNDPVGDIDYLNERLNIECLNNSIIDKAVEMAPESNCMTVNDYMVMMGDIYYYRLITILNGENIYYYKSFKTDGVVKVYFVSKPYLIIEFVSYILPHYCKLDKTNMRFYLDDKEIVIDRSCVNDFDEEVTLFFNEK